MLVLNVKQCSFNDCLAKQCKSKLHTKVNPCRVGAIKLSPYLTLYAAIIRNLNTESLFY